jgi:UTP:GlnB (protein PII) uridylyltransferase
VSLSAHAEISVWLLLMRYSVHFVGAFFHVQEAHVFSTTDGMALEVFVVEGWDGDDVKLFFSLLIMTESFV